MYPVFRNGKTGLCMYLELFFVVCRFFLALRSREERREYGDERRDKDREV